MQFPSELHAHKGKSGNPSKDAKKRAVTPCLGTKQDKAMPFQGMSPLVKLLCTPNWKPLPPIICPSELTKGFLLRRGKGIPNYNAQLHVVSSSGNKNSLAVKIHIHLTNGSTSSCNSQAWLLLPVQLFVLPSAEPRNETTSFSHRFIFQLNEFPRPVCCTAPDSCFRGKDLRASAIHIARASKLSLQPNGLPRPALFTIPPTPLGVSVAHAALNITEIIWAKYKFPKPERAEEPQRNV